MESKKTILVYEKGHEEVLADLLSLTEQIWSEKGCNVIRMSVSQEKKGHEYLAELKEQDADYLISFAMAGFSWKTLASQVSYNLLYAKQIHILIGDYDGYEEFLKKEYAISLFFFTDHKKWIADWEEKYPGIPFLKKIPSLYIGKNLSLMEKQTDKRIMTQIIDEVMDIVEGR